MRIESRKRRRAVARRLLLLTVICGVLAGAGYSLSDHLPKAALQHYWDQIASKLPFLNESADLELPTD